MTTKIAEIVGCLTHLSVCTKEVNNPLFSILCLLVSLLITFANRAKNLQIQRGGQGVHEPSPPNHKNIGFPSNTDQDLLKLQSIQCWAITGI